MEGEKRGTIYEGRLALFISKGVENDSGQNPERDKGLLEEPASALVLSVPALGRLR